MEEPSLLFSQAIRVKILRCLAMVLRPDLLLCGWFGWWDLQVITERLSFASQYREPGRNQSQGNCGRSIESGRKYIKKSYTNLCLLMIPGPSRPDITKARNILAWSPKVNRKEGFAHTGIFLNKNFATSWKGKDNLDYRGAGFIGSHAVRHFFINAYDYEIVNIDAIWPMPAIFTI